MSAKSSGLPSTANSMSPSDVEIEAGRGDDDVGLELLAGLQQDAVLGEALDLVGDDGGLAGLMPWNRSPSGMKAMRCRHGR